MAVALSEETIEPKPALHWAQMVGNKLEKVTSFKITISPIANSLRIEIEKKVFEDHDPSSYYCIGEIPHNMLSKHVIYATLHSLMNQVMRGVIDIVAERYE